MTADGMAGNDGVIDTSRWLKQRVESLIAQRRFDDAIRYLHRLRSSYDDGEYRQQSTVFLGYLYLLSDDLDEARRFLDEAMEVQPHNPHLRYALGHVAVVRGDNHRGVLRFLEAFVEAGDSHDEAEFLRSAALAILNITGPGTSVATMLLGALDRDLGNPWILDALAGVYAADERWMETLETLSTLSDVVSDAAESMVMHRAPTARQLLRNQLMGRAARPDELRRRVRAVNRAVRDQFEVVLDEHHRRGPTQLTPLRFPTAMKRLLRILGWRDRGVELVESAQNLWARALAARFDEVLGQERLAAAIQILVERLHWRVPTPHAGIARLHGAAPEAIQAAARVIAGRLGLEPFSTASLKAGMTIGDGRRLDEVSRALLFGQCLQDVRSGDARLG